MRTTTRGGAAALAAMAVLTACGSGSHQATGAGRLSATGPAAATAPAGSVGSGSAAGGASAAPAQRASAAPGASTGTPAPAGSTAVGASGPAPSAPGRLTPAPSHPAGAGSTGSAVTLGAPACALSALRIQALRGGASMGQEYALLMFTNDAATACRLDGYPTVSLRSAGTALGSAQPAQTSGSGSVTLRSAATAQVQVRVATDCAAGQSDTVQVGVPQADGTVTVPLRLRGCSLRVGAFEPAG